MTRLIPAFLAAALVSGCAFLESAGTLSFGEGEVDRLSEEVTFPNPDDFLDLSETEDIPGFPSSLAQGTFAHLAGALALNGECQRIEPVERDDGQTSIENIEVRTTVCSEDDRCSSTCGDFLGVVMETVVDVNLLDDAQVEEIKDQLSQLTTAAIVQIRLQFHELQLFQDEDGTRVVTNDLFGDFAMGMRDPDGNEVIIVEHRHLAAIDPETPQRFALPGRHPFTIKLKEDLLNKAKGTDLVGQPLQRTLFQRMRVPRSTLYDLRVSGAGLELDVQPEFVISVLEVAKSKI